MGGAKICTSERDLDLVRQLPSSSHFPLLYVAFFHNSGLELGPKKGCKYGGAPQQATPGASARGVL